MFLVPIPEDWAPAERGWLPADTKTPPDSGEYFLRWSPPVRFPASLAVFRNPETGQRLAWYGPLATSETEQVRQGPALAEIGITPADWGPEDRQPEVSRRG
jgi:hypothetical protein